MTTVQVDGVGVDAQPVKPANVEPPEGAAVSVTVVLGGYGAEHVGLQAMPPVSLVTVPAPVVLTLSVKLANLTLTARDWFISTVHEALPTGVHPVKPTSPYPVLGVAVSVTVLPAAKAALHAEPQLIRLSPSCTVPAPLLVTLRLKRAKVAVTVRATFSVTLHDVLPGPLVELHPLHPVNPDVTLGTAVTVTGVSGGKSWEQSGWVQVKPGPVTVPEPPFTLVFTIVSVRLVKVAVTAFATFSVTVHVLPAMLAQPLHEVKTDVDVGVAVSTTVAFGTKWPAHDWAQLIPAG